MQPPTFEETYPRYEFSELVRIGIACAGLVRRLMGRQAAVPVDLLVPSDPPEPLQTG